MYIKITYSNGYCGCDEVEYAEVIDDMEANRAVADGLQLYSFFEPDSRFVDDYFDEFDEEAITEYEEAVEAYQQNCYENSYWEEITKEEYEENI